MTAEKYNGWTNYETWNVKLWIDNDQGASESWQREAEECYADAEADKTFSRLENAASALAERLKTFFDDEMHENGVPELQGCYADLLDAALSEVNWLEIAENMLEDIDEDKDEE